MAYVRRFFEQYPVVAHFLVQAAIFGCALIAEILFDVVEEVMEWVKRYENYEIDVVVLYAPFGITYAILAALAARGSVAREANRHEAARLIDAASGLASRHALDQAVIAIDHDQRPQYALIAIRIENYLDFPRGDLALVERALFSKLALRFKNALSQEVQTYRIANDTLALLVDTVYLSHWRQALEQTIAEINDPVPRAQATSISAQLDFAVTMLSPNYRDAFRAISNTDAVFDDVWYCKQAGGMPTKYYDEAARERKAIRNETTRIFNEEFIENALLTHFQPVFDLRRSSVVGAESMVRLQSQEFGMLSANEFLPVAQRLGQMRRIDWLAASAVANALSKWPTGLNLTLNISRDSLQSDDHMRVICQKLLESGANPSHVGIEVPEALIFDSSERIQRGLQTIRNAGFAIIIDGFGESHGVLAQLASVQAVAIKLPRALIAEIQHGEKQSAVIASVIELAHRLGMRVIAKGVENAEQFNRLKAMDCDAIQGHYVSQALSFDEFLSRLTQKNTAPTGTTPNVFVPSASH